MKGLKFRVLFNHYTTNLWCVVIWILNTKLILKKDKMRDLGYFVVEWVIWANLRISCWFLLHIIKIKFWFILGLPYGAFNFSEDEKRKNEEKEEKLAEKHPEIFNKISDKEDFASENARNRLRFVDFENLTMEEKNEALWDHYQTMNKWNSLFIVDEFWNNSHNFIGQSHLQCYTNIL